MGVAGTEWSREEVGSQVRQVWGKEDGGKVEVRAHGGLAGHSEDFTFA